MEHGVRITYCLTAELSEDGVRAAVAQLSADERSRHDRFRQASDRRDFALAHALLRRSLSACGDRAPHEWTFTTAAHGKPALAHDVGLAFNLAHTDGLVACCVGRDAALGIDVEKIGRRVDARTLAERFFSPVEVDEIERCPEPLRQTRFIEIWTLKEAYVKAIGDGLAHPLDRFAFHFDGGSRLRFQGIRSRRARRGRSRCTGLPMATGWRLPSTAEAKQNP